MVTDSCSSDGLQAVVCVSYRAAIRVSVEEEREKG